MPPLTTASAPAPASVPLSVITQAIADARRPRADEAPLRHARPLARVLALYVLAAVIAMLALTLVGCGDPAPCVRHSDCAEEQICGPLNHCIAAPMDGGTDDAADVPDAGVSDQGASPDLAQPLDSAASDAAASDSAAPADLADTADLTPSPDA